MKPEYIMSAVWGAIVVSWVTIWYYRSNKKAIEEKGLTPTHTQRCAGIIGFFTPNLPILRVALYNDFMVISHWKKLVIPYAHIKELDKGGVFGDGLMIVTTDDDKYGKPVLFPKHPVAFSRFLEEKIHSIQHS